MLYVTASDTSWGLSRYDSTVRNAAGNIVQFLYGEDGMDGTQIEAQKVSLHMMDDKKFRVSLQSLPAGLHHSAPCKAVG